MITYLEAVRSALADAMRDDDRVFLLGEDIGHFGGAFGATGGLQDEFGVKVEPLAYGDVPACRPGGITYLLYGPTNPLAIGSAERAYLAALDAAR